MNRLCKVLSSLAAICVAGCASNFAGQLGPDHKVHSAPGTITVSDPKLYSREALINERAKEVARIQKLIDGTAEVAFLPDVYRETEQITAFAAALGLKFDPAAGKAYSRSEDTGDIQQEINTLRLQLQLDQLRRDAELMRAKLPEQTEPVNTGLGTGEPADPAALSNTVTAASIDQLKTQIDALLTAMRSQFSTDAKAVAKSIATVSPLDDFRDRQAYLDLLRSAKNAASLDELHDQSNAALVRLNFQASVVPDQKYAKSLGVVQVQVRPGQFGDDDRRQFLSEWLDQVNTRSDSRNADGTFKPGSDGWEHQGLRLLTVVSIAGFEFAFPDAVPENMDAPLNEVWDDAEWASTKTDFQDSRTFLSSDVNQLTTQLAPTCGPGPNTVPGKPRDARLLKLDEDLYLARARLATYEYAKLVDPWLFMTGSTTTFGRSADAKYLDTLRFAADARDRISKITNCRSFADQLGAASSPIVWGEVLGRLRTATQSGEARIYEVGPREQVQQMSTTARAASSLALAASIAASAPGSGRAAEAAASYSKQAMGRATMLERLPSVVGYTVGGQQTFGWVLGPRMVIDPKQSIVLEQLLKPYDLSVDMSVPAWWPSINLELTKVWGPSPQLLTRGQLVVRDLAPTSVQIPLPRRAPDFDWFTQQLTGRLGRDVTVVEVKGGPVNACSASTLLVSGRNIWRTEKVLLFGHQLEAGAITIAPDMRGILLNVPVIPPLAGAVSRAQSLIVITPYGRVEYTESIPYASSPSGEDCKARKAEAAADPAKIAIEKITPNLSFTLPAAFSINVQGKNLDKVTKVTLHGQAGTLKATGTDALMVSFTVADTQGIPATDGAQLEFFKNDGKKDEVIDLRAVRVTR